MKKTNVKRVLLVLLAVLSMVLLSACGKKEEKFDVQTKEPTQRPAMTLPKDEPKGDDTLDGYDPTVEEDNSGSYLGGEYNEMGQPVYAGATPVPLDPIDKPTATPRPELTFTYVKAQAPQWGIQFEIPGNWMRDESQSGMIVFTDPTAMDNVNATLTMRLASVGSDYKVDHIKDDIKAELQAMGQYNFIEWDTTRATARKLMDQDGYYADYRGVKLDGTIVRGRVQMALFPNGQLFTLSYNAPGWFNSSYKNVFDHVRSTMEAMEQQ